MKCKYFTNRLHTIIAYDECLHKLKDCANGGLLHVLLDNGNYEDKNILSCLQNCITNPDREESELGKLICTEYLKLSIEQRRILYLKDFDGFENLRFGYCCNNGDCKNCIIEKGENRTYDE